MPTFQRKKILKLRLRTLAGSSSTNFGLSVAVFVARIPAGIMLTKLLRAKGLINTNTCLPTNHKINMNDAQLSCILKLHMHWKQTKLFCACEIQWLNCKYLSEKMCAGIKPLATKSQIRTDLGVLIFYVSPLKVSNYLPQYIAKHSSQQKHSWKLDR